MFIVVKNGAHCRKWDEKKLPKKSFGPWPSAPPKKERSVDEFCKDI